MAGATTPEVRRAPPDLLPVVLTAGFTLWFVALAIDPVSRRTWLLENLMAVPLVVVLWIARRRLPFSSTSSELWKS